MQTFSRELTEYAKGVISSTANTLILPANCQTTSSNLHPNSNMPSSNPISNAETPRSSAIPPRSSPTFLPNPNISLPFPASNCPTTSSNLHPNSTMPINNPISNAETPRSSAIPPRPSPTLLPNRNIINVPLRKRPRNVVSDSSNSEEERRITRKEKQARNH